MVAYSDASVHQCGHLGYGNLRTEALLVRDRLWMLLPSPGVRPGHCDPFLVDLAVYGPTLVAVSWLLH